MSDAPTMLPPPAGPAISPTATAEEAVAIVAAVEALWPRAVVAIDTDPPRSRAWRFSGRWWARPVSVRRERPWR